jgi:aspartate dehydrogenase
MRIALIGCGAIGRVIAEAVKEGVVDVAIDCLYDLDKQRCEELATLLGEKPRICLSIEEVLNSKAGLVVEAASQKAVKEYALDVLKTGKSLLVMSVGALLDEAFYNTLKDAARANKVKIYVPSGAIGGLDALKAASIGKIYEVKLVTTKHPRGLKGAPYLRRRGIRAESIREKTVLYEGSAFEAVKEFPANVNVSAALSLAGIGAAMTRVVVIADPGAKRNFHEIIAKGDFGSFALRFENLPSPGNPRTSFLAALSAIAILKRLSSPVEVGT